MKRHHVQTGVGHYGVFNGRKWETQIYPMVRATIHDHEPRERSTAAASQAGGQVVSLRSWIESSKAAAPGQT